MTTVGDSAFLVPRDAPNSLSTDTSLPKTASKRVRVADAVATDSPTALKRDDPDEVHEDHTTRKTPGGYHTNSTTNDSNFTSQDAEATQQRIPKEQLNVDKNEKECREVVALTMTATEIYIGLANILRPSESVLNSMQRLGEMRRMVQRGGCAGRWCSNREKEPLAATPEQHTARKRSLAELTELCNKMVALGHFDIFEETYENVIRILRQEGIITADWRVGAPVLPRQGD